MKTITCDLCEKTVRQYGRLKWSIIKHSETQLCRIDMSPFLIMDKELDLCDQCTATMMEWVYLEIESRPEEDDD